MLRWIVKMTVRRRKNKVEEVHSENDAMNACIKEEKKRVSFCLKFTHVVVMQANPPSETFRPVFFYSVFPSLTFPVPDARIFVVRLALFAETISWW